MRRKLWIAYINISMTLALLVALELMGQLTYFVLRGYPLWTSAEHVADNVRSRRLFEIHPYLGGRPRSDVSVEQGGITISTTEDHTRWTELGASESEAIRIAVLGGSTTFGTGVTDADTWPAILQSRLGDKYTVTNFGVPGYSTAEAIIQMALIVPELRPNVIVQYHGWNDIRNYHDDHLGADYYGHGIRQYSNLGIMLHRFESLRTRLVDVSSLFRFAQHMSDRFGRQTGNSTAISQSASRQSDATVDRLYERNLETLRLLASHIGAYSIFVPQVINYEAFRDSESTRPWTQTIVDDALPELLDRFNLILSGVCNSHESECGVLQEVAMEQWRAEDFADDGHFSRTGGERFAEFLESYIEALDL